MADLDPAVRRLLEEQHGLVSVSQLREAGCSRSFLRGCLRRGWRLVLPGVVATTVGRLEPRQQLMAAWLYAGPDSVVTSTTAARWRGLKNPVDDGRARLFVPLSHTVMPNSAVVVRRSQRPDPDRRRCGGLVIASAPRAVADSAREAASSRDAGAVVVEAVQRELVTLDQLRFELEDGPRCGSTLLRQAIDVAASAAWSMPEHDVLELLRRCGLFPVVWANPSLRAPDGTRLPTPDGWLDDVALAIQVHSRRHHFAVRDWENTLVSDGVFAEYGITVLAFSPRRIREEPDEVVRRVARVYQTLRHRPRPDVIAVPRLP